MRAWGRHSAIACVLALTFGTSTPAQEPDAQQAREVVQSLLVASPYRIGEAARAGEIRYRLAFADGIVPALPRTGEQTVTVGDDGTTDVAVCVACRADGTTPDPDEVARALAPNAWVDSDHRDVVAFARRHARGGSVDARMRRLVEAIRVHMDGPIDFRGYRPASLALHDRGGDCTEFALLLAATARAARIPTRVVHGLAYSSRFIGKPHVFGPHSWVQAWDGTRWRSYDAGLGQFDAGHIAFRIGDGSPADVEGLASTIRQLRIVSAAGVRDAASLPTRRP